MLREFSDGKRIAFLAILPIGSIYFLMLLLDLIYGLKWPAG